MTNTLKRSPDKALDRESDCGVSPASVHMVPFYVGNPYQTRLKIELESLGVRVSCSTTFWDFVERGLRTGECLHLHWPPRLSKGLRRYLESWRIIMSLMEARRRGSRTVWTIHNLRDHETSSPRLERLLYGAILRSVDRAVVHTESARQAVAGYLGRSQLSKIHVVPHANYLDDYPQGMTREDARARLGLAADQKVFLFFGFIRAYKNVGKLIVSFTELRSRRDDVALIVAGRPWNDAYGRELLEAAKGVGDVKMFLDYIDRSDVQQFMAAADAVVFPYHETLTSGAVMLAMSFGNACVIPDEGAFAEVVDQSGVVSYDPDRESGLMDALEDVCKMHGGQLREMGAKNLERARGCSWGAFAEKTLNIYNS